MNQVKDAVLSIRDNIKNGIGDRLGGVRDAVTNAMNAVYSAVMDKVNSSWSWGRDLMQNLINGITYMLGSLIKPMTAFTEFSCTIMQTAENMSRSVIMRDWFPRNCG